MIVISHCYSILKIPNNYLSSFLDDFGRYGVLIFLLITANFYTKKSKKIVFSLKNQIQIIYYKVKKIYFFHLIGVFFMICVYVYFSKYKLLFFKIICNLFLIQSYIPIQGTEIAYSLNTPSWYLSMMIFIWLLSPIMIIIYNKNKSNTFHMVILLYIIILGVLLFYNFIFYNHSKSLLRYVMYVNPFINFLYVLHGMFGINFFHNFIYKKSYKIKFFLILVCIIFYFFKNIVAVDWRMFFLILPTELLISVLVTLKKIPENYLSIFLEDIGKNSSIIMLTHYPICYTMRIFFKNCGILFFIWCILNIFLIYRSIIYIINRQNDL